MGDSCTRVLRFLHGLLRSVVYKSLPGDAAQEMHRVVLGLYEEEIKARADEAAAAAAARVASSAAAASSLTTKPGSASQKKAPALHFPKPAEAYGPGPALLAHHARAGGEPLKVRAPRAQHSLEASSCSLALDCFFPSPPPPRSPGRPLLAALSAARHTVDGGGGHSSGA